MPFYKINTRAINYLIKILVKKRDNCPSENSNNFPKHMSSEVKQVTVIILEKIVVIYLDNR